MASTYLTRTFGSAGNRKTWTMSSWFKLSNIGSANFLFDTRPVVSATQLTACYLNSSNFLVFGNGVADWRVTTQVFRDTSAWYHLVVAFDSTQSTASNRIKIYINGEQITSFSASTDPAQNTDYGWNQASTHYIGSTGQPASYFDGSMSHIHFIDGTAYDASAFGQYDANGVWKIKTDVSVTYGNNGFFILKDGNSVTDQSGNGNNFTVAGGTLTKTEDSPSNVFATWNPLQATTAATYDFVKGNTRVAANDVAEFSLGATLAAKTGKYYMEMIWVQHGGYDRFGMMPINANVSSTPHITGIGWDESSANLYMLGNVVSGSWGANMSTSDIIQIALDLDNGAFYLGVNGTWRNSGDPTSGASRTGAANFSATSLFGEDLTFAVGKGNAGTSGWNANFGNGYIETVPVSSAGTNASGNGIFEFDVPTGYTALSTKGLNL